MKPKTKKKRATRREKMRQPPCEQCGQQLVDNVCLSGCLLYNAAVTAAKVAAQHIASARLPGARDAYLNEYGIFAWVFLPKPGKSRSKSDPGVLVQIGSAEEAAPFDRLTTVAIKVKKFWSIEKFQKYLASIQVA